jgi:hypothetical protein
MKGILITVLALWSVVATAEDGFVNMFNGKDLTGWENPYEWGEVKLVGDEIQLTTDKSKFFLVTEKKYKNFIFEAEIMMPEGKSNSGFLFRCLKAKNKAWGYQAEVDPSDRRWSGGFYDEGRRKWMNPDKDTKAAAGTGYIENKSGPWSEEKLNAFKRYEWNKYRIECNGTDIKIFVNGIMTSHVIDSTDAEGYIGLQHHGEKGKIYKFKNIRIKELN